MSTSSLTLPGQYYDGRQPVALPAQLVFTESAVTLIAAESDEAFSLSQLQVSPRIGKADRFVALPNGGQFQCKDDSFLDSLPQESRSEGVVAWLESRVAVAVAGVAITVSLLLAIYFYGLPIVAKRVAARIPVETEQAVGRQALFWLDHKSFTPSKLAEDEQQRIRTGFKGLCVGLPLEHYYYLEFRGSKNVGANAFALPGGTIVITDDMVKAAKSQEEILAVLAHEIGHEELNHTMRSVLQSSVVAVTAATVTSDATSFGVAVAGLPALLAQTRYSRRFETEADDFAFKLLKRRGYSPAAFASIMERLAKDHDAEDSSYAFLSTHPITAERVSRARAAARQ